MTVPKPRIIGITEPITWYEPDDSSEPSCSAIGIEGLKPILPGGYAHTTFELIHFEIQ